MPRVSSLYYLIKNECEKKERPLKIITDWDDCMQLTKPVMIYNGGGVDLSFEEFFEKYSKMEVCSSEPSASQMVVEGDDSELTKKINEFEKKRKELRGKGELNPYKTSDFYDKSPFTSIADDVLRALKENLIEELVIMSQYTGEKDDFVRNKESKIKKTFQKFPQIKVHIDSVERINNPSKGLNEYHFFRPYRHEIIAEKFSDFDIFVDDNPEIIEECQETFLSEKIYAMPDYKSCQKVKGDNVYFFKNVVTDLKDSDFVYQEKERKENIEAQGEYDKEIEKLKKEKEKLEVQMGEIANIINPDTNFEFTHLKREIEKLKIISQIRIKELELKKLASFVENELKDDKKAQENLKLFLQGKIKPLKKEIFTMDFRTRILDDKLINIGGLQTILDKQKEISCLEEQLINLQIQGRPQAQIEIPPKVNK